MILLAFEDFIGGKYDIPDASGLNVPDVQECIDRFEKNAIYQLLGVTEGDKFITWIQASKTPANTDYSKILNPFASDDGFFCGKIMNSLGMKEYLKAEIFYQYTKVGLKTSQAGVAESKVETATAQGVNSTMRFADNKFNDCLDSVEAIQWYCQNNKTAFPDFNGQWIAVKCSNLF